MWKHSGSFWAASLIWLALSLPGCAGNDDALYQPGEAPLTIQPTLQTQYDVSPAVSADAAVLAWVRLGRYGQDDPYQARVLRMRRSSGIIDTVVALPTFVDGLDLSPDGSRLLAVVSAGVDTTVLLLWRNDAAEAPRLFPPDFSHPRTPRWDGESSVLFGAAGPYGGGVYRWDLTTNEIAPVAVRYTDPLEDWTGRFPGIDRSGRLVCMERRTDRYTFQAMARSIDGTDRIAYAATGGSPHFWQVLPGEPDGLTYLDPHANLWAVRLATGDLYHVLGSVYEYDVSPDGRWIFARASVPYLGLALVLRDLRDIR